MIQLFHDVWSSLSLLPNQAPYKRCTHLIKSQASMDARSVKQRRNDELALDTNDRLSQIPRNTQLHTLSFLDLKENVRLGAVSKSLRQPEAGWQTSSAIGAAACFAKLG